MTFFYFIISHVHTSTQFGQDHYLNIFIFNKYGMILFIFFLIGDFLYYRIRVYRTATSLIHTLFQKYWIPKS